MMASTLPATVLLGLVLLLLSMAAGPASAQFNPVTDFCRRFGHQTAVIDRKLYIDGGMVNYSPLPAHPNNYTNTFLLYQDLDTPSAGGGMPQLYANLSKNDSIPSVSGGILWPDTVNKRMYLWGGDFPPGTAPPSPSLYSYDTLNNLWLNHGSPQQKASGGITSTSYGAGVSISEKGEAYYLGGWSSNASVPGWTGDRKAAAGLLRYRMDSGDWASLPGPDARGRAEGVMLYLPVSDGGMLAYFGGVVQEANGTVGGAPMAQVQLFDLASSRWYTQHANGTVPEMRARFCAGAALAPDQSSYNIYLYGGAGMPPSTAGFDDVYILSLPSFTWIKMYPNPSASAAGAQQYPHNTLTCNVIDNAQMIIIGGSFPLDQTSCDAADQFGSHGLDMGRQNADDSNWFLYRKNITSYVVPRNISGVIGGGPQGGATKLSPDGGFDAPDLKVLMSRRYTAAARQPTRDVSSGGSSGSSSSSSSSSSGLSTGAIVGIAVGGAALLIIAAVLAWCCLRRRGSRRQNKASSTSYYTASSMPDTNGGSGGGEMAAARPGGMHQQQSFGPNESIWSRASQSHGRPGSVPYHQQHSQPAELGGGGDYSAVTDATKYGIAIGGGHSPAYTPVHPTASAPGSPGSRPGTGSAPGRSPALGYARYGAAPRGGGVGHPPELPGSGVEHQRPVDGGGPGGGGGGHHNHYQGQDLL